MFICVAFDFLALRPCVSCDICTALRIATDRHKQGRLLHLPLSIVTLTLPENNIPYEVYMVAPNIFHIFVSLVTSTNIDQFSKKKFLTTLYMHTRL